MIALAIIAAASIGTVGVIAIAPLFISRNEIDEACGDAERQPDGGPICAWCFPGVDHPAGHGICKCHAAEFIRTARENQMEDGA